MPENAPESEGRTPKQERKVQRKFHRKLARYVEDLAYGIRQVSGAGEAAAYGTRAGGEEAAYGAKATETEESPEDRPGVRAQLREMLDNELRDLFREGPEPTEH